MSEPQVVPTTKVTGEWRFNRRAKYPDVVHVKMDDGVTVTYCIVVEQPAPYFRAEHPEMGLVTGYERRMEE